jgi:hypothetical protein
MSCTIQILERMHLVGVRVGFVFSQAELDGADIARGVVQGRCIIDFALVSRRLEM